MIDLGRVRPASSTSSAGFDYQHHRQVKETEYQHICTAQSKPHKEPMGVRRPIMADKPVVRHPPPFVKVKRASVAVARGERIHNGTIMAKSPIMWMMRTTPSIAGNFLARTVLKMTQKKEITQTSKVPCQRSKLYVGLFKTIRPCMIVPTKKATDRRPACHPVIQIHPSLIGQNQVKLRGEGILYRLYSSKTFDTLPERILTPSDIDPRRKVP